MAAEANGKKIKCVSLGQTISAPQRLVLRKSRSHCLPLILIVTRNGLPMNDVTSTCCFILYEHRTLSVRGLAFGQ